MAAVMTDNAIRILKERYLVNGESVEGMFRRVSNGNEDYFNLMSDLRFTPNSPALFNLGLNNGCTSSACFFFSVADSMLEGRDSIVDTRAKAVAVAKAGGGVGYYFGNLRPKGSLIKSVHRKACGPCAVLRDYNAVAALITQGGKRDLAQMGILPCWHEDIKEFIHVKDQDPQGLGSFNISVSWQDDWVLKAATSSGCHEKKLWDEQVESAWSHGCPGMFFYDTVNKTNPNKHLGLLYGTNPCGEVPLRNNEPCNLGSLNLVKYFNKGNRGVDLDRLWKDASLASEFLDDILDWNVFPHPDITDASLLTRKLGLGVMGWADLLALCHIPYDSLQAVNLGSKVMATINDAAHKKSVELAKKKGPYKGYSDKTEQECRRNETNTCIAPTGTIALIAGVFGSIEPHFQTEWERTTKEGIKMKERISVWDELEGFVPKTAGEVAPEWHVKHQAAFQEHTDLAVSKTANLPNNATKEDVSKIYRMMHQTGCKGGTVYRDGCRDEQVLVSGKTKSVFLLNQGQPQKKKLPPERPAVVHKFRVDNTAGFITVGLFGNGRPAEIFLRVSKIGSTVAGLLDTWAISFSIALQSGTLLEQLCEHHKGTRFEPCGMTDDKDIPVCTSIPDYVCRWLEKRFPAPGSDSVVDKQQHSSGQLCPECGREAVYRTGCLCCTDPGCSWTRCG